MKAGTNTTAQALRTLTFVWNHPANRSRRLLSITRAVAFQVRSRLSAAPVKAPLGYRSHLLVYRHSAGASKVVYANPPDWPEMQTWARLLGVGDVFVDVGANAGLYSVWAAELGAKPIAVEPDPDNKARIVENFRLNHVNGEVHECALGSEPGSGLFSVGLDTLNHVVTSTEATAATREVRIATLDGLLRGRSVRGVKIDVEGFERLVVEGAFSALAEGRIDVLQLEWNDTSLEALGEGREPVAAILIGCGYTLCRPDPDTLRLVRVRQLKTGPDLFAVSPRLAAELVAEF